MYFSYIQITLLITSYFVCSIPFGLIITKIFAKKDIRKYGSGNIGATNVTRIMGKKLGLLTLILDGSKGALMVIIAKQLPFTYYQHYFIALIVLISVIGHIFPIYLKFKGGKGVATTLASLFAYNPYIGFINIMIWLIIFGISRTSSISSILSVFITFLFLIQAGKILEYYLLFALFILILIRHADNIIRLFKGKELKFKKHE